MATATGAGSGRSFQARWREAVASDPDLSTAEKCIAYRLADYADADGTNVRPAMETVGKGASLNRTNATRKVTRLRECGYLVITLPANQENEAGRSYPVHTYRLVIPATTPEPDPPVPVAAHPRKGDGVTTEGGPVPVAAQGVCREQHTGSPLAVVRFRAVRPGTAAALNFFDGSATHAAARFAAWNSARPVDHGGGAGVLVGALGITAGAAEPVDLGLGGVQVTGEGVAAGHDLGVGGPGRAGA